MIEVKNERERRAYVTPTPLKDDISLARCIPSGIRTRVVVQLGYHCMHAVYISWKLIPSVGTMSIWQWNLRLSCPEI